MSTALVPVSAKELDPRPSLEDLEQRLRGEHEACVGKLKQGMEHALRAGEVLLEIRSELMARKEWVAWLGRTPILSRSQAYTYMRLFTYRDHLPDGFQGIASGEVFLKGLPAIGTDEGRARLPDPIKADAKRMRKEGLGYKEIAKRLEVSPSTVHNWFNGSKLAHQRRASRALQEKKHRGVVNAAVKKAGGALAEAYSMAERLDDVLGQAHREATDSEARRELARAHEYQRAMRDAIVRSLGVEG